MARCPMCRFSSCARRRPAACRRRRRARGVFGWLRANLFSSPFNIALTLVCILFIAWIVPPLLRFLAHRRDVVRQPIARPAWPSPATARPAPAGRSSARGSSYFVYGFYPIGQRWRVDLFFLALAFGIGWLLVAAARHAATSARVYFFIVLPILSLILLSGLPLIGLA